MKTLFIFQTDIDALDQLAFALESKYGANIKRAATFSEAQRQMGGAEKTQLAVVYFPKTTVQEHEAFFSKHPSTSFIYIIPDKDSRDWTPHERLALTHDTTTIQEAISAIDRWVAEGVVTPSQVAVSGTAGEGEYCRIRTKVLLSVVPLKGDIFIKLSDSHFVKMFHEGDQFDRNDMEHITVKKGVEYLYIRKDQSKEFVDKYCAQVEAQYAGKGHKLAIKEVVKVQAEVYETVHDMAKEFGFTKDVQMLAKTQIQSTLKIMGKSPKLRQFLDRLSEFEGEYLSAHSLATGYLACAIASHLEWGSETTFSKLTLASFLHDITLDQSELAKIRTMGELQAANLSNIQRNDVTNHTMRAAEISRGFSEVPPDVDSIILQHHEMPDGSGFPRGLKHTYISPLAAIFGVAHDIAHFSVSDGKNFKIAPYIESLKERFQFSNYKKIFVAIEEVFHQT